MRSRNTPLLLLSLSALILGACSPSPAPVATSPSDPSNPKAAEGMTPPVASTTTTTTSAPTEHGGHEGHGDHGGQQAAYVCPMHPEVTSNAPGLCPKCNMKLVPKK